MPPTPAARKPAVPRRARPSWFASPWRIAARAVGSALAIVALGALLALVVVPRMLGGDALTVLTGSMEPTLSPGDVAVVRGIDEAAVCTDVSVGSIVTFFPEANDPSLITHRVVGKTVGTFEDGTSCRLITQGDANSAVDAPVSPAQVRGTFMYGVPGLGWVRQWAGDHPAFLIGGAAALLVGWLLLGSLRKPRTTVVSVPRATPPPRPAAAGSGVGPGTGEADAPRERDLRERELTLRERELELRERELAFAMSSRDPGDTAPVSPAAPSPDFDPSARNEA